MKWDEDRETRYLDPRMFSDVLDVLESLLGVRFTVVVFQAYRNGAGVHWHNDPPFDAQAIVSMGSTRRMGLRRIGETREEMVLLSEGSVIYMPPGFQREWEHCIDAGVPGDERVSLVFRTPVLG